MQSRDAGRQSKGNLVTHTHSRSHTHASEEKGRRKERRLYDGTFFRLQKTRHVSSLSLFRCLTLRMAKEGDIPGILGFSVRKRQILEMSFLPPLEKSRRAVSLSPVGLESESFPFSSRKDEDCIHFFLLRSLSLSLFLCLLALCHRVRLSLSLSVLPASRTPVLPLWMLHSLSLLFSVSHTPVTLLSS